jgi:hypothetical protein
MSRTTVFGIVIFSASFVLSGCSKRTKENPATVTSQSQPIQTVQAVAPPAIERVELYDYGKEKALAGQIKQVLELARLRGDDRAGVAFSLKDVLARTSPSFKAASNTIVAGAKQLSSQDLQAQYVHNHLRDDAIDWATVVNESSTALQSELRALQTTHANTWEVTSFTWLGYDGKRELLFVRDRGTDEAFVTPMSLGQYDRIKSRYYGDFHQDWVDFVKKRATEDERARRDREWSTDSALRIILPENSPQVEDAVRWAQRQNGTLGQWYLSERTVVAGKANSDSTERKQWSTLILTDKASDEILLRISELRPATTSERANAETESSHGGLTFDDCYSMRWPNLTNLECW